MLLIRRATGVTLVRYRLTKKKPRQASFEAPTPGRTFGECVRRVHKRAISPHYLAAEWIQAPFTAHSNACACSREGGRVGCARTRTREWICHLIIMSRKILANGEHTEGCNYDPFQRAHALWQCLHFHPDGEKERRRWGKKKIPRNDGKMCPSSQLRTIILGKKIVSIAFEAGSKAVLMGVMAGNGGDSGRRSDIFGWRNCWLRACKGLNYTKGWWESRSCEVE